MKRIIIMNGVARAGKDTLAEAIMERGKENGYCCHTLSTVDKVKQIGEMMGAQVTVKTDRNRKLWSDLKDLWTEYNNGPFEDVCTKISYLYDGKTANSIYVIMCREPKEIQKFKEKYGFQCLTILVKRDGLDVPNNHADQNVENFDYDMQVDNAGTVEDLHNIGCHICDTLFD